MTVASLIALNFVWAALFTAREARGRRRDARLDELVTKLIGALDRLTHGLAASSQAQQDTYRIQGGEVTGAR